jgi:phosphatidyl-myo-inositol dimannoside synthase
VFLFSFDYPPIPGGIARLCSELARELKHRGELEAVFTSGAAGAFCPGDPFEVRFSNARPAQEYQAFRYLSRHVRDRPVLCGLYWPEGAIVLGATRRAPFILAHGTELLVRSGLGGWVRQQIRRLTLERARLVLANSRFTAELVSKVAPAARCTVLPLAVDHERFCPGEQRAARLLFGLPEGVAIVATVGRVQPYKGHRIVIEALARLEPELRARVLYVIAGTGPSAAELEAFAKAQGVLDRVKFLGYVPERDLPNVYRAADLHALLSERTASDVEGFGLVSLEAQACGVPALGSRSGGIEDAIVPDRGGWLVPTGDIDAVQRHLAELVNEPATYKAAGVAARERVLSECTWAHCADALLRAVQSS